MAAPQHEFWYHPAVIVVAGFCAVMALLALADLVRGRWAEAAAKFAMGAAAGLLALGAIWLMLRMTAMPDGAEAPAAQPRVGQAAPGAPIEMRRTGASIGYTLSWTLGLLFTGVFLLLNPDTLWTRWLTYPVAVGALALAAFTVWVALGERNQRIVADGNGVEIRYGSGLVDRVAWKDVAKVAWIKERRNPKYRTTQPGVLNQYLSLQDKSGEELMRLEKLAPPEDFQRFLDTLPAWTGRPLEQKTVNR